MPEEEVIESTVEELVPPKTTVPKPASNPPIKKPIPKITPAKPVTKKPIAKKTPSPEEPKAPIKRIKPIYKYAGTNTLAQILRRVLPKQFIITSRFTKILELIFLATIILALVTFPFGKMLSGDSNITIGIGYPLPFLELQIEDPTEPPIRALNLLIDIILFSLLSYIIDVLINFITDTKLLKSKEELKKQPKTYRRLRPGGGDKIAKKIFQKKTS